MRFAHGVHCVVASVWFIRPEGGVNTGTILINFCVLQVHLFGTTRMARGIVHYPVGTTNRLIVHLTACAFAVACVVQRFGQEKYFRCASVRCAKVFPRKVRSRYTGKGEIRTGQEEADGEEGSKNGRKQAETDDAGTG